MSPTVGPSLDVEIMQLNSAQSCQGTNLHQQATVQLQFTSTFSKACYSGFGAGRNPVRFRYAHGRAQVR